ncbi:MAG TPA: hypothetical protein VF472_20860 [Burkholderiaceae bacterium]
MKIPAILALCVLSLSACVSTGETYTAQGDMVYEVSCRFRSIDACLEEAGNTCGILGYREVQKDGSPLPPPAAESKQPSSWDKVRDTVGYDRKIYMKCGHAHMPDD